MFLEALVDEWVDILWCLIFLCLNSALVSMLLMAMWKYSSAQPDKASSSETFPYVQM